MSISARIADAFAGQRDQVEGKSAAFAMPFGAGCRLRRCRSRTLAGSAFGVKKPAWSDSRTPKDAPGNRQHLDINATYLGSV